MLDKHLDFIVFVWFGFGLLKRSVAGSELVDFFSTLHYTKVKLFLKQYNSILPVQNSVIWQIKLYRL